MAGREAADAAAEAGDMIRTRARTLSRTFSNLSSSPVDSSSPGPDLPEIVSEMEVIPPLPLNSLLDADKDESGTGNDAEGNYSRIFFCEGLSVNVSSWV